MTLILPSVQPSVVVIIKVLHYLVSVGNMMNNLNTIAVEYGSDGKCQESIIMRYLGRH